MKAIKLAELLRGYDGKWVALNRERTRVLASARSLDEVLNAANKLTEKPIISYVSPLDLEFVG